MMMKTRTIDTCFDYQRFFLIILLLLWELTSYCQGIVEISFSFFLSSLSFQRIQVRIIKIIKVLTAFDMHV